MVDWAWSIQSVIQAKRSSNAARGIWPGGSLRRGEARLEPSARGPPCPLVGEGAAQRRCACAVLRARVGRRARRRDTRVGPARADGFTCRECAAAGNAHERPVGMAGAGKKVMRPRRMFRHARTHTQATMGACPAPERWRPAPMPGPLATRASWCGRLSASNLRMLRASLMGEKQGIGKENSCGRQCGALCLPRCRASA